MYHEVKFHLAEVIESFQDFNPEMESQTVVGKVVARHDDYVVICPSFSGNSPDWGMKIPLKSVSSIKKLNESVTLEDFN